MTVGIKGVAPAEICKPGPADGQQVVIIHFDTGENGTLPRLLMNLPDAQRFHVALGKSIEKARHLQEKNLCPL